MLEGKIAAVTGAGGGIGREIAIAMARAGAKVLINDVGASLSGEGQSATPAEETKRLIEQGGGLAAISTDSVAEWGSAQKIVQAALDHFGGLDIVVNNAAILRDAFIFKADPLAWDAVLRNNLSAAFHVLAAATPLLRDQLKAGRGGDAGWGRIVNIVSSAGLYGNYGQAAYASAKAGLFGLTRVTAMDLQRAQITVNAVAPFARTRVTDIIQPANEAQKSYKERALKIGAHHVANLVTVLCSPAGKAITGQLLGVRGREVFLFSQPRPVARVEAGATLAQDLSAKLADKFTDLTTDLEAFNTEPLV